MRRFIKLFVLTAVLISFARVFPSAKAQETTPIEFGRLVSGEVSSGTQEINYVFNAQKGDTIVVQVVPQPSEYLNSVEVRVSTSDGKSIADSGELIIFGRLGLMIAAPIKSEGEYTITVYGKNDGGEGKFDLIAILAEPIGMGKEVGGEVSSIPDGSVIHIQRFYVIDTEDTSLLVYTRGKGKFNPSVVVFGAEAGNNLLTNIYMAGRALSQVGTLIPGNNNLTIVAVGDTNIGASGNGEEVESSFTLSLGKVGK